MRWTDGQWLLIRLLSVSAQFYKYRWIPDDLKNWIVKKLAFYISWEGEMVGQLSKKTQTIVYSSPHPTPPPPPCKRRTSFARVSTNWVKIFQVFCLGSTQNSHFTWALHRLGVYFPLCLCLSHQYLPPAYRSPRPPSTHTQATQFWPRLTCCWRDGESVIWE